jgi:cellulose synthase (UDP-forming)
MPELFEPSENPTPPDDSQRSEAGTTGESRSEGARPEGVASRREDVRARHLGRDAHGQEIVRRPVSRTQRQVVALAWVAVFFMLLYPLFILLSSFTPGYSFADRIANILLILGTLFIFIHGLGYANSMIKASLAYDEVKRRVFSPQREPKVVCLIACFNEPLPVLEETVAAMTNMDYGNKEVVILDDSTKEEIRQGVRELATRYGATARQRTNRRGYKAGAINDFLRTTDASYIAVFDADGLPAHNLLRDLMPIIEENPRLAFVQTPQYYANTDVSNVALAAGRQQTVFYEYISEGKSYSRSAFCCGTNCIFRRDALLAVGGFDETSVTEDFTTSLGLHLKGYDSTYYNQVYAYGMAPETLGAYFTQQSRWAFGSVGGFRRVLKALFTRPGAMSMGQWWEYFLSSTYYWIGWVNFIFMVLPMLYIFFGVQPLRADVFTYMAIFVPYLIFSMNMFYTGMEQRGYKVGEMLLGQSIGFLSFPVHMTAAISGILGLKRPFSVTPKDSSGQMNWLSLWPQLLMFVLSAVAVVWGLYQYAMGYRREDSAIVVNVFWALYQALLLSGVFFLNRGVRQARPKRYFSDSQGELDANDTARVRTGGDIPAGAVTTATGRISRPPIATPLRPQGRGLGGHVALMLGVLSLILIVAVGATMLRWAMMPSTPVNVYILDRTAGRDYQEHRMLTWTLNFLKVKKDADINPAGISTRRTNYNWAEDYFGFVPAVAADAQPRVGQVPADI